MMTTIKQELVLKCQPPRYAGSFRLTGIGFSLIFLVMGMEVIHRFSASKYGRAIGAYSAFFDLAMGLTVPAMRLIVPSLGYFSVFSIGTVACPMAMALSFLVINRKLAAHFFRPETGWRQEAGAIGDQSSIKVMIGLCTSILALLAPSPASSVFSVGRLVDSV